jgi:hypothetical protein
VWLVHARVFVLTIQSDDCCVQLRPPVPEHRPPAEQQHSQVVQWAVLRGQLQNCVL